MLTREVHRLYRHLHRRWGVYKGLLGSFPRLLRPFEDLPLLNPRVPLTLSGPEPPHSPCHQVSVPSGHLPQSSPTDTSVSPSPDKSRTPNTLKGIWDRSFTSPKLAYTTFLFSRPNLEVNTVYYFSVRSATSLVSLDRETPT